MHKKVLCVFLALAAVCVSSARADFVSTANRGNDAYKKKDYKGALDMYHSAETDMPESPELKYNIAGALHQEGSYQDAIKEYEGAIKTTDIGLEARAHYNLGNTYFKMKEYQKAIASYEESLKLNPKDMDAKFNLELSRKMLKEQIKPQNQQNQKDQQKKDEQQKQNQQNQQDKQDQQNQDQQQNKQDQQKQDQQKQQQNAQDQKKMSKEDAARILNALKDDEQQIQKKVRREHTQGDYFGKDW